MKAFINGNEPMEIEFRNGHFYVSGKLVVADLKELREGTYHLLLENRSFTIDVIATDAQMKKHTLLVNGTTIDISLKDKFDDLLKELGIDAHSTQKATDLKAPMPGLVVGIQVTEGSSVEKGETLVILEAMKMENSLKAVADAVVKKVLVKKGQAVEKNEILIQFNN